MDSEERDSVVRASPKTKALLRRFHAENTAQEQSWHRLWYQLGFTVHCVRNLMAREAWNNYADMHNGDQLLSHSREKCELIYMLACLNGAKSAVECGTSFGVSTIYLALAISRNVQQERQDAFGVLTVEKDGGKVRAARKIWAEAGDDVESWITSEEGDLLEALARNDLLPETIDLLFLDAWTSLALPALKLVLSRLRPGSLVFADKTSTGKLLYEDLLQFVEDPENGFMSMTIPFTEGFEVMIYQPEITSNVEKFNKDNQA